MFTKKQVLLITSLLVCASGCTKAGTEKEVQQNEPAAADNLIKSPALAELGHAAPEFMLTGLDGKLIASRALRGKVVLIDFWASWCGPCIKSMPAIKKLNEAFGAKDLVVLAVTLDDDEAKLRDFLARQSPGGMVVRPNANFNRAYGTLLHLNGNSLVTPDKLIQANLPTWILIDRKGRIAAIHKSSAEEDQVIAEATTLATRV